MPHKYLMKEFEEVARAATSADSLMQHISQRIHLHIPRYNWVGFYLVDKSDAATLTLGPYTGSFVPPSTLSMNQGLCGSAVTTGRVIIADNVAEDPRYIAASDLVKSQISAPLVAKNRRMGVFNVESYFLSTFKAPHECEFVENCARLISKCFERMVAADLVQA